MSKPGEKVEIQIGGKADILEQIGSGGQGTVYKVAYEGKQYALKWYHKPGKPEFYTNLKNNIEKGSPAPSFLWPQFLTKKDKEGCFGYLMNLRDPAFKDFGDFLLAKERFKSVTAMIEAAIQISISFRELHSKGYSYQDLNDGNFFINPITGDVLICDNDNVAPYGTNTGILGKCRYMAPEVVLNKKRPDAQSDRFSLSVILFLLFFNNHPLEGEQITSCACMTEKHEKKFYGTSPVFIYDPSNPTNRPVRGIHSNVIRLWPQFPQYVRDVFIKQFSEESFVNPNVRQTEKEWLFNVILRLRNELFICPFCKEEYFADSQNDQLICDNCRNTIKRPPFIHSGKNKVAIYAGKPIYEYITKPHSEQMNNKTAEVVESKKTQGLFGLKNLTNDTWILTTKSGATRPISPNESAPLLIGNNINFGNGNSADII